MSPVARQIRTASIAGFFLAMALFLMSCAAPFEAMIQDDLPPESPRGYLEFYCIECIAGWGVFRIESGEEVPVGQQPLGRKIEASIENPVRIKRLRIAQAPGSYLYSIRLLPYAFLEDDHSTRIHIRITENELTPYRIDFSRETSFTFRWKIRAGPATPLVVNPESLQALASGLNDSEWETRWYAVQALGRYKGSLPPPILTRLEELSSNNAYRQCRETATTTECSELRKEAVQAVKKMKATQP